MVEQIGKTEGRNRRDLIGLKDDIPPTEAGGEPLDPGSTYYDSDNKIDYIFTNGQWKEY